MSIASEHGPHDAPRKKGLKTYLLQRIADPAFQKWAARFPLIRRIAARDGTEIFEIVQGFVKSQVLFALVELRVLHKLYDGPRSVRSLAQSVALTEVRLLRVLRAADTMQLVKLKAGNVRLTRKGAAILGVPGLEDMILHHSVFYRDMEDPVRLLRGEVETELAQFWPYVFGAANADDPETSQRYSTLMARTQELVSADTLDACSLAGFNQLLDIGGGTGVFAREAVARTAGLSARVFDLPVIEEAACSYLEKTRVADRLSFVPGSFREDPLPTGSDVISIVRVLYDHEDETVIQLLKKAFDALPPNGRLVISEPMSGGASPHSVGDIYFAFYCLAMKTGTVRSADEIASLCKDVGFTDVRTPKARRPFITQVVIAQKPPKVSSS